MHSVETPTSQRPLRLWPGACAVTLQWLLMFGLPRAVPEQGGAAILAGFAGALAVMVWWLFFSRAPWVERAGVIALMIAAVAVTSRAVHASIANGMMGFMLFVYAMPVLSLALVASAAATRNASSGVRRAVIAIAVVVACAALTLVRTNGISGNAVADFEWRWTPTAEERLLAHTPADLPPATREKAAASTLPPPAANPPENVAGPPPAAHAAAPHLTAGQRSAGPEWPGFRGPARDSVVRGVRIETDWARTPPVQLWRRPVGPGWSSFAVDGDRFFTQEQRGEEEVVSAYRVETGEPIWRHGDTARFWESNAGAGPRATPTLHNGRVYTLGGTGILNALDARDGSVVWSRNAASHVGRAVPDWGIASSPLVVGDVVIVATGGWLSGYDAATGDPRWSGPKSGWGYSSPHLSTIDGVAQIVLVNGPGVIGVAPSDGTVLWKHEWAGDSIVQPALVGARDLLIGSGSGLADQTGTVRIAVAQGLGGWTVNERWMSTGLKSYFNDFVVHQNHAFGFDGSILACIDLEDGRRKWKGGRYGHGQLLLLPDQNLLLVLSEEGDVALVSAAPDKFTEIARVPALDGKTWNHPVLVGNMLLLRNGEEMAAFRMPQAGR